MNIKWYKCQELWAWGLGDTTYRTLNHDICGNIEDCFEEWEDRASKNEGSDKWRYLKIDEVDGPDPIWLESEINRTSYKINDLEEYLKFLEGIENASAD